MIQNDVDIREVKLVYLGKAVMGTALVWYGLPGPGRVPIFRVRLGMTGVRERTEILTDGEMVWAQEVVPGKRYTKHWVPRPWEEMLSPLLWERICGRVRRMTGI
jgi:hypothetical protein